MRDPEYWKRLYKHLWKNGNIREGMFVELAHNWGLVAVKFGFEAESSDYNPNSPDEKGKPDYYIDVGNERIYFEVTGTDVSSITPEMDLWVRPDKIDYVERHNINGYVCHILNNRYNKIRFINLNNIDYRVIVHPFIRGIRETYVAFSYKECISVSEMRSILRI